MKTSFFKTHVLPVFFIFLIPGFGAWFFGFAEQRLDRRVLEVVEIDVRDKSQLPAAEQARLLAFYRRVPVSRIMASSDPKVTRLQPAFSPVRTRYAIFRWMKRTAWACLATIGLTLLIVGISVAFSFRSQAAQYYALRIGWPVLRTSAAIQVLGQAVLAVALSFWVTAILTESYFLKLIGIITLLALGAVIALFKAIFTKTSERCEVNGEILTEADAPTFWGRVKELASALQTNPPDQIVVGIDPSFFVTEHPVTFGSEVLQGRTLYLSLPMLKVLGMDEVEAVLGHELAHFSGQDTLWSRKISPLLGKFAVYLQLLGSGLSLAVAHFMLLFWKLYGLSIHRLSRAREFRADRVGAGLVSPDAMMRALIKVTGYCEFRAETEQTILNAKQVDNSLDLARQLEGGYPAFLAAFAESTKAIDDRVPHPFDRHPPLSMRLEQLGFEAKAALRDHTLQTPAAHSWYGAIATAPALEAQMWAKQQAALQAFHQHDLAWRIVPIDGEQAEVLQREFPRMVFKNSKTGAETVLDFDRLQLGEWSEPIFFKDIVFAELASVWTRKRLTLTYRTDSDDPVKRAKFFPGLYLGENGDLLACFSHYYSRHKTAEARTKAEERIAAAA